MFNLSNKLELENVLPSKVYIWKLRCSNPLRKSFNNKEVTIIEFDALTKITVEMSRFLYPYIRAILNSRDNYSSNPNLWDEFKSRYIELILERFNTESLRVKNLSDSKQCNTFFTKLLLNLALCSSDKSHERLKMILGRL